MPGRDTKTKFQGVFARHQEKCKVTETGERKDCNCRPSYYGTAWDREAGKPRKTPRVLRLAEARNARNDLLEALRKGTLPRESAITLGEARGRFVKAAREGVALTKWRRRYRPRAVEDLESALAHVPDDLARRRLDRVKHGDLQALVDKLTAGGLSGSRIRSVVNAVRSLYRWAQDRELVGHDPAQRVKLPATDAKPRERVATPTEFASLLDALVRQTQEEREKETPRTPRAALRDSVPFALDRLCDGPPPGDPSARLETRRP